MPETYIMKKTILIDALPERVWGALINPEMIEQYLFGTHADSDWKEGSQIIYRGVWEGKTYEDKGLVVNVRPAELLETRYWSSFSGLPDRPENYQTVKYQLSRRDTSTELTVIQHPIANPEAMGESEANWSFVLENLKNLLEKNKDKP